MNQPQLQVVQRAAMCAQQATRSPGAVQLVQLSAHVCRLLSLPQFKLMCLMCQCTQLSLLPGFYDNYNSL